MVTEQWVFAMYGYLHALRKASLVMLSVLDQAKHCSENQKAQCQPKSSEIKIPNQLSCIYYYGIYLFSIALYISAFVPGKADENEFFKQ